MRGGAWVRGTSSPHQAEKHGKMYRIGQQEKEKNVTQKLKIYSAKFAKLVAMNCRKVVKRNCGLVNCAPDVNKPTWL